MSGKNWLRLFVIPFLVMFITSLIYTIPVRADGSIPPPVDPPTSSAPANPTDPSTSPADPAAVSTTAPDPNGTPAPDAGATSVNPTVVDQGAGTSLPSATDPASSPTSILSQVPTGTNVVVVDRSGRTVPLATQEAAKIITTGDPIWCPSTVAVPVAGASGCSPALYNSDLVTLVNAVSAGTWHPNLANSTIWITAAPDLSSGPISLNGSSLPSPVSTLNTFTLTLKGGWSGSGSTISGTSTFTQPISITGWKNNVTLSDIQISGVTGDGLNISTTKNIKLTGVGSNGNTGRGAKLDNSGGTGTVTINTSTHTSNTFNTNTLDGLDILSKGAITLNNLTASSNTGVGASLNNPTSMGTVSITNGTFDSNAGADGLNVTTKGAITLSTVSASSNTIGVGAILDNSVGTGSITINSTSVFSTNHNDGLDVTTKGAITLNSVTASSNTTGEGASLNNSTGTGAVSVTTGIFSTNALDGLDISSKGAITLNSVTANTNTGVGASLNNPTSLGAVSITSSHFDSNAGLNGLDITTKGAITLNSDTASSNTGGAGAILDNSGSTHAVTITSSIFSSNHADGLDVTSRGTITLTSVTGNGNGTGGSGAGASLDNCQLGATNCTGIGSVTITLGIFNSNQQDGIDATSGGAITVNSLQANSSVAASGSSLINSQALSAQPISLAGTLNFDANSAYGISIQSIGLITINSIHANGNDTSSVAPGPVGVSITNALNGSHAGITLTGTNVSSNNYYDGFYLFSNGPIKLNNLTADNNTVGAGAFISNDTATSPQPVTITGTNEFNTNGLGGLIVYSNGAITTYNLTANTNLGGSFFDPLHPAYNEGVYLDNCNDTGSGCVGFAQPIKVLGNNTFDGNFNDGLNVQSLGGAITVNNIEANNNGLASPAGGIGAILENDYSTVQAAVNITSNNINGNVFNGNFDLGLEVFSNGAITANHVTANATVSTAANNGYGALFDNCDASSTTCTSTGIQPVTLTGINEFNGNPGIGLVIESRGTITVNNLTANTDGITSADNGVGAYLQNNFDNSTSGVTIAGTNVFNGNYGTYLTTQYGGLTVLSKGVVKANNLFAESNTHGDGVYINNTYAVVNRAVTLTGINTFNTNGFDGLDIESFGNISAINLNATGNGTTGTGSGAFLNNAYHSGPIYSTGTVTLTGTNLFTGNNDYGLETLTRGAITVMNLTGNGSTTNDGVYLDNTYASTAQPVTVNGSNSFQGNNGNGLKINTNGAITLKSVTAIGNVTGYGAWLTNSGGSFAPNVTLLGSDLFLNNSLDGLRVSSDGSITLNTSGLTANSNGAGGSDITDSDGVYLENYLTPSTPKSITINGSSSFDGNFKSGIVVFSKGAITAGNITSSNNVNGWGVDLSNDVIGAVANITLNGNNTFYGNGHDGLTVSSRGAITVGNIVSNDNGLSVDPDLYGIWLNNTDSLSNPGVTVKGTNVFNGNKSGGFYVASNGAITVNNVTALGSLNGDGGTLTNTGGPSTAGVTFTGANFFQGNNGDGLNINTNGKVTLTNINADGNTGNGLNATTPLTLSLTCGSFINNTLYGITISTGGKATFTGVALSGNHPDDSIHQTGSGGAPVITGTCLLP